MMYPKIRRIIPPAVRFNKIMTSVAFLNREQKRLNVHGVLNFGGQIFLDCGIFQRRFYERLLTKDDVDRYRDKLLDWYSRLLPDFASSLDLPFPIDCDKSVRDTRLRWSVENYVIMRKNVDLPLVLGINVFSKTEITHAKRFIHRHLHEDPELLGLGGLVPVVRSVENRPEFAKLVTEIILDAGRSFPSSSIHVYGLGDPKWYPVVRLFGASSSDYAGYLYLSSRGLILLPGAREGYILKRIKLQTGGRVAFYTRPSEKLFSKDDLKQLDQCTCVICRTHDPLNLEYNRQFRIIHNLSVVLSENKIVDEFCSQNDVEGLANYVRDLLKDKQGMKVIRDRVSKPLLKRG